MAEQLVGALVGVGRHGAGVQGQAMYSNPGIDLRAVVDDRRAVAADVADHFHCEHRSIGEVLTDPEIQALVITTPSATHPPLILDGLAAGKKILCEKPVASSFAEALVFLGKLREWEGETGKSADKHLMIGHQRRFDPTLEELQDDIDEKRIKPWDFQYQDFDPTPPDIDYLIHGSGGIFFDLGVHSARMVLDFLGIPAWVAATAAAHLPEIREANLADVATMKMGGFPGGDGEANILLSYVGGTYTQQGVLLHSGGQHRIEDLRVNGLERWGPGGVTIGNPPGGYGARFEVAFERQMEGFREAASQDAKMPTTAADGVLAMAVCEAARLSVQVGQESGRLEQVTLSDVYPAAAQQ